jgi:cadmium resistance transport/sequestration family protein
VRSIGTAIATFAATNIDDIVLLMLWFSQTSQTLRGRHIVAGQYLGFSALIALSLLGFIGSLVIPPTWIGLLGVVPILLGVRQLWQLRQGAGANDAGVSAARLAAVPSGGRGLWNPHIYGVAAVTFANGGDNLGIYIPLFASSTLPELALTVTIFLLLIAVWCYTSWRLTRQPLIAAALTRYGHVVMPFVLIGLGLYILIEQDTLSLFGRGHCEGYTALLTLVVGGAEAPRSLFGSSPAERNRSVSSLRCRRTQLGGAPHQLSVDAEVRAGSM